MMTRMGRPTKYKASFCKDVLEHMGEGYSKTATAGFLGIARSTFHKWCEDHPDFSDTVKRGEALRTAKLETDLLSANDGPTVTSRIFALKNAAPEEWRDRQEVDHSSTDGSMTPQVMIYRLPDNGRDS